MMGLTYLVFTPLEKNVRAGKLIRVIVSLITLTTPWFLCFSLTGFALTVLVWPAHNKTWALSETKNQHWQIVPSPENQMLIQQIRFRGALYKIDPEEIESVQKSEDGVIAILSKDGSVSFYAAGTNPDEPAPRETRNKKGPGSEVVKTSRQDTIRKFLLTELASLSQQEPYPEEEIDYLVSNLRSEYIYQSRKGGDLFSLINVLKDLPPRTEIINLEADLIEKFIWELDDKEKVDLMPRIYELMTLAEPVKNPPGDKKDYNLVKFYNNGRSYEYTFNTDPWKNLFSSYMGAKSITDANPSLTNPVLLDKVIATLRTKGVTVEEITNVSD